MNAITGTVEISLSGQSYTLRFDWDGLAAIEVTHGENPNLFDVDTVASIAAIGFRRQHPELTAAKIKELSPPLLPFALLVQQALQWAYFGPEGMPDEPEDAKKKTTPKKTGFWKRIVPPWPRGLMPTASGD